MIIFSRTQLSNAQALEITHQNTASLGLALDQESDFCHFATTPWGEQGTGRGEEDESLEAGRPGEALSYREREDLLRNDRNVQ
jgi:hypothetical protein